MTERPMPAPHLPRVICLMGPTASGKTALAEQLARHLDCELISVDSALVYRGMNIGTAKPATPHRLVDIRDPGQPWSVAEFCTHAEQHIREIVANRRTPLLVGGSMLYFKALFEGLAELPAADPQLRRQLAAEAEVHGWPHLHRQLAQVDPAAAARIHPNHSRRIARALEVYRQSGETLSALLQRQPRDRQRVPGDDYEVVKLALCPRDRKWLHRQIELRLQHMIEQGLVDEVRGLFQRGDLHRDMPSMRAVAYQQLWRHFEGEYDLQTALERCRIATRQLAKRQMTWLRGGTDLHWIHTDHRGVAAGSPEELQNSTKTALQVALNYSQEAAI